MGRGVKVVHFGRTPTKLTHRSGLLFNSAMKQKTSIKVNKQALQHLATLANIDVSDSELIKYQPQLSNIISYVEQLDEVDTSGLQPTYQVLDDSTNVTREDNVVKSLSQTQALSQAKHTHDGYFVVKGVFSHEE